MSAFTIDTNNFNNEVLNSDKPVLVDSGPPGADPAVCWPL